MSKKKTILLVRNIHIRAFGGAEVYQVTLADCLKQNGFNPIIFTSSKPLRDYAKRRKNISHHSFYLPIQNWSGFRNIFLPLYFFWQALLFVWYISIIIIYRPTAIHIQSRDDFIAGTLAGKLFRRKVIWTDHSDLRLVVWENINKKYKNPIGKIILKIAKLPDCITTVSDYEYKYISRLIAPRKLPNFQVVKNGAIDQYEKYKNTPSDLNSIAFIGRLEDYKGVLDLAKAFKKILTDYPYATLHFYGTGPALESLKSVQSKGMFIHGHTNVPLRSMAEHSIFVLPSYREGLSLSLIDAAMMQRTIIASSVDGNPEVVINGKTGLLVPPKDVDSLALALRKTLRSQDYAKKLAMAARRRYLENFNFETIVKEQIIPLYLK